MPKVSDPLITAQKILCCVIRLNQNFGQSHVAKVVKGSSDKTVLEYKHDQLSTYGVLSEFTLDMLESFVRQLVEQKYLEAEPDLLTLSVTPAGRQVIQGLVTPVLKLDREAGLNKTYARKERAEADWDGVDRDLFEALRRERKEIALENNVPPYVILHDTVLRDLARYRPTSRQALLRTPGIGERKVADFGERLVAVIRGHKQGVAA